MRCGCVCQREFSRVASIVAYLWTCQIYIRTFQEIDSATEQKREMRVFDLRIVFLVDHSPTVSPS